MVTKHDFFKVIYSYYVEHTDNKIQVELLKEISERIADHYFEQYSRFRLQYPKSIKRYSSFKIEDLNHPEALEIVTRFFKERFGDSYADYSTIVLKMPLEELKQFEKGREQFYNK